MGPNELLERTQWDFFWLPGDTEILDRADLAAVRSARGWPHLNCVTRTRCGSSELPERVAEVSAFHAYGVSRWMVPDTFDTALLEEVLSDSGYTPLQRHEARAIRPADYRPRPGGAFDVRRIDTAAALRDCIEVQRRAFGHGRGHTEQQIRGELAQCMDPGGRIHRFVVYRDAEPVSSGGFNWFPDLRFAFLWAGGTVPEARGAGAYSALVAARVRAAWRVGAEWVGLYALEGTSAPVVARQGFAHVGDMTFWERRVAGSSSER